MASYNDLPLGVPLTEAPRGLTVEGLCDTDLFDMLLNGMLRSITEVKDGQSVRYFNAGTITLGGIVTEDAKPSLLATPELTPHHLTLVDGEPLLASVDFWPTNLVGAKNHISQEINRDGIYNEGEFERLVSLRGAAHILRSNGEPINQPANLQIQQATSADDPTFRLVTRVPNS